MKLIPDGLGVRIPGFHPGGPGSIPGLGDFLPTFLFQLQLSLIREKSLLQEERRQRALERKAAIMDLSADLGGNKAKRQLHNEDELIPPALEN